MLERVGVWLSHRAVARVLKAYERPRVLDLGCGYRCALLHAFAEDLGPSTGVDLAVDPAWVNRPGISALQMPIEDAWSSIAEVTYDVVTMINVLEHLWRPLDALTQAFARLRPGGTLVVNVPTWLGKSVHELQAFRLGLSSPVEIDDHKFYFNRRDLWPLLVRAGFRPSMIQMRYHKCRLNLFATARRA